MTRRPQDERGAVAITVAVLCIGMVVLCAFAVDLGMAYNSKRQLQTAADSAALAAAATYIGKSGTCAELTGGSDAGDNLAEADAAADDYRERNRPDAEDGSVEVSCNAAGELEVTYEARGSTETIFGRVGGAGDDLETARTATALLDAPLPGSGMRPLAVCGSELPSDISVGNAWKIIAPGNGHVPPAGCPIPPTAGNWWTLDCGEEFDPNEENDGGGTSQMVKQVKDGCKRPITVVPGQGDLTGAALNAVLAASCSSASEAAPYKCLSGDPGSPDAGQVEDSWKYLIDNGITISLPVFCAPTTCATTSVTGTGTNAIFPVHRMVTVDVCGYHFGKNVKYVKSTPTTACSPLSTETADLMADGSDLNYMLLVFQHMQVTGTSAGTGCGLGEDCDTGTRRVHLID